VKLLTIMFVSAVFTCLAAGAQQPVPPQIPLQVPPPQPQSPGVLTLHASSRAVLVDVVVTDKHGKPIHGLRPENFQLLEDGQVQTIASMEEHHAPSATELASTPPPPLGPNTFTNARTTAHAGDGTAVVFLLDALNSPLTAQMYVRDQLISYFKSMTPGTQVAIFKLDAQLRLLQGFTSDADVLREAIKDRDRPELSGLPNGRGYVAQAMHMDSLDSALQTMGKYLATWPGRKDLIWFTGRIPRDAYDDGLGMGGALHDSESFFFDYKKATESLVLGQVSVYPIDARGLQTDPAYSAANGRAPSHNSGTRFATAQFFQHQDLEDVAEATGGKAFYNTNGIKQAVAEVVDADSSFYTLSYYPSNKDWNGKYRKLKVEFTAATESGVVVRYRRGYYAVASAPEVNALPTSGSQAPSMLASLPAPEANGRVQLTHHDPATPGEGEFVRAMQLGAVDPGQIVFKAVVSVDPAVQKLTKDQPNPKDILINPAFHERPFRTAQITWHVPGGQLELDPQTTGKHTGSVEFAAVILDDQGIVVDSSSATVDMALTPKSYDQAQSSGVAMILKVAIPEKGTYFLRTGVRDVTNGRAGALEVSTGQIKLP
jgi:VWFA-related protein